MSASRSRSRRAASSPCYACRLVIAGKRDRLIPWKHGQRLADEVADARLLAIDIGNHGCANVAPMHRYPPPTGWLSNSLTGAGMTGTFLATIEHPIQILT